MNIYVTQIQQFFLVEQCWQ